MLRFVCILLCCGCGRLYFTDAESRDSATDGQQVFDGAPIGSSLDSAALDVSTTEGSIVNTPDGASMFADSQVSDGSVPDASRQDWCTTFFPDAILCDGFNNPGGTLASPWTVVSGNVAMTSAEFFEGTGALVTTVAADPQTAFVQATIPRAQTGSLFVRMSLLVPSSADLTHVTLLSLLEDTAPWDNFAVVGHNPNLLDAWSSVSGSNLSAVDVVPRDRWFCLQVGLDIGTNATVRMSIDGTTVVDASNVNTTTASGYAAIAVGNTFTTGGQGAATIYVDGLVVDTAPIGCG